MSFTQFPKPAEHRLPNETRAILTFSPYERAERSASLLVETTVPHQHHVPISTNSSTPNAGSTRGTIRALRAETRRRETVEQELVTAKAECQNLANGWATCSNDLVRCDAGRFALAQEVQRLQNEIAGCQAQNHSLQLQVSMSLRMYPRA